MRGSLTWALCVLLALNIIVMGYHAYKLSHVTAEIEAIKEAGRSVREMYTLVGGSMFEKVSLAREKVTKIPSLFRGVKKLFVPSPVEEEQQKE